VYNLRPGVRFHNGDDFTAEDVAYTYERLLDPEVKATNAGQIEKAVERVEAVDQTTVRFTLRTPNVTWPAISTAQFIVPKRYASELGPQGFANKPVGTGPFILDRREINYEMEYSANLDYWNSDPGLGIPVVPTVDKALLRVLPESETRISAMLAGEVDIIVNVPSTAIKRLEGTQDVQLLYEDTGQPLGILINSQREQSSNGG
jgi:peptide/nickel transport system substrate-binding protein